MKRVHLPSYKSADRSAGLDPEADCVAIYRSLLMSEFPWDLNQSLSLALFRTYAVPSIGRLLDATGGFTTACQKRYDDTVLLLEAPVLHGFDSPEGRAGIRRVNQMHAMYDISNDDMRYVLSTFVVVPKRWLDDYGWRPLSEGELTASVHYYRALGRRMAIKDVPETYEGFADLMDAYEREHFGYDEGGRRVADATLDLMASFYPRAAAAGVRLFSRALMDQPLLDSFDYDAAPPLVQRVSSGALKARARVVGLLPPRRRLRHAIDTPRIRSYTVAPDLSAMGTFAPGCPVGPGLARATAHTATAV
ncbi:oxygenase MpaB family protein [Nocardioides rubriscoriae]|uniref:oxygenase MpaB family protein n=1 Tax=Nocardioides rubriscoriae TaxID=642762 RepID=UPI0011E05697|nr:oxygenase MpaB family protein [Nocardioides rubriscoriae]